MELMEATAGDDLDDSLSVRLLSDVKAMWPDDQIGWDALAYYHREMPRVEAESAILEDSPLAERLAFINSSEAVQKGKVVDVVHARGLNNTGGA